MKAKNKDNILVDMYGLNLTENPEQDRDIISEFLRKYAPAVARYLLDSDISGITPSYKGLDVRKYRILHPDGTEYKTFDEIRGESWFKSDVKDFYDLVTFTRKIIDLYFQNSILDIQDLQDIEKLLEDTESIRVLTDKNGVDVKIAQCGDKIDMSQFTFRQKLNPIFARYGGKGIHLTLAELKFNLYNAIMQFVHGEVIIRKCHADCKNIYIPTPRGRNQEFCSDRCYKRTYTRARRKKIKESVFV